MEVVNQNQATTTERNWQKFWAEIFCKDYEGCWDELNGLGGLDESDGLDALSGLDTLDTLDRWDGVGGLDVE